jgi:hypothetical protein
MVQDSGGSPAGESKTAIGFLSYRELTSGDGYHAGLLVTDSAGKPIEFRCTSAVRPNAVQRTLYGGTLMPYIAQQLFALPLVRAVQSKPRVVLVEDEVFLGARPSSPTPLLWARRQGEALQVGTAVAAKAVDAAVLLDSPGGRYQPVVIRGHPTYPDEASELRGELRSVFGHMDILEPFSRVARALEMVEQHADEEAQP